MSGCTITNVSDTDVQVRVVHRGIQGDGKTLELDLPRGESRRTDQQIVSMDSHKNRKPILSVTITQAGAPKIDLTMSFKNIKGIQGDWHFVVDSAGNRSVLRKD
jgi:hypothetical protein